MFDESEYITSTIIVRSWLNEEYNLKISRLFKIIHSSPNLAEHWSRDHLKSSFSPITSQGCIFTLRPVGMIRNQRRKYVDSFLQTSKILNNMRIPENFLESDLVCTFSVALLDRG